MWWSSSESSRNSKPWSSAQALLSVTVSNDIPMTLQPAAARSPTPLLSARPSTVQPGVPAFGYHHRSAHLPRSDSSEIISPSWSGRSNGGAVVPRSSTRESLGGDLRQAGGRSDPVMRRDTGRRSSTRRRGQVATSSLRDGANVRHNSTLCGEEAPLHELGVTQSIVDQVAQAAGDTHVSSIRLEIGKLSGVSVDSIRFCFELVASGTVLEGADLRIDMPAGRAVCG